MQLTNIGGETHRPHALAILQSVGGELVGQVNGLLLVRLLGRHINRKVRTPDEVLVSEAVGGALVDAQEHDLGDVDARVKLFNGLLLRQLERVPGHQGLDVVVGGIVDLGGRLDQRRQVLEDQEPRRRVVECAGQERVVFSEEGQSIQRRACGRHRGALVSDVCSPSLANTMTSHLQSSL